MQRPPDFIDATIVWILDIYLKAFKASLRSCPQNSLIELEVHTMLQIRFALKYKENVCPQPMFICKGSHQNTKLLKLLW